MIEHVIQQRSLNKAYQKVACRLTMKLLRKFLRAPMQIDGKLHKRRKGVPQGSPLSPLLSNILLNELDTELEKRGHRYVRYADDFSIYVRSRKAARRVGNSIYVFLKDVLRLPINRQKSGIRRPSTFEVLHLAPLEETGTQTEKPDAFGCETGRCLCMESRHLSGMGGWRVAQSPILKTTITLARMKKRGYIAMLELFHQIRSK